MGSQARADEKEKSIKAIREQIQTKLSSSDKNLALRGVAESLALMAKLFKDLGTSWSSSIKQKGNSEGLYALETQKAKAARDTIVDILMSIKF